MPELSLAGVDAGLPPERRRARRRMARRRGQPGRQLAALPDAGVRRRLPQHHLRRPRRRGDARRRAPPWAITEHAVDLAALIEAVCGPPVFLVGLSMGSLIAVQIAHDRPELVRSAVVMGTCVRKTGFIREWEEAEIAFRREGGSLPPAFATAHYAMQYYPADALGDDETWERIKPFVAADFAARDGAMLAAQWQACLDYDSGPSCCRGSPRRSTRSRSPRTCRRRPGGCARWPSSPPTATSTCSRGSATARPSATGPRSVNACLRSIIDAGGGKIDSGSREPDVPDAGVDDLQDLEVAGEAAEHVGLPRAESMLGRQARRSRCARRSRAPSIRSGWIPIVPKWSGALVDGQQPARRSGTAARGSSAAPRVRRRLARIGHSTAVTHTSPSPWAAWGSPHENSAPGHQTGSHSVEPAVRWRVSMLPPPRGAGTPTPSAGSPG